MLNEKKVLGKGLSALILDNPVNIFDTDTKIENRRTEIDLNQIEPNPWQPRKNFSENELLDLKNSILEHGLIQPIIVRHHEGKYQIVAGERRWQASKLAGKQAIVAIVVDFDDKQMLEAALVENIQRQDLNPIEEAKAFKAMMEQYGYTQEQISKKIGKSRSFIANSVRLLTLPEDVQNKLIQGEISASHARTLVGKENASEVATEIVDKKLNVRFAEGISKQGRGHGSGPALGHHNDSDLAEIERSLSEALQMNVRIKDTYNGGILSINFLSLGQLDQLIQKLSGANLTF
ncbi:MAG: parB-like partition protein [Candidatus Midichloriaceae bacterium]|jgi:ParB family chromosome partitioning protein|nr:parB-like partition protein [Candidatus Midichloriaceae bacterium]